MMWNMIVPEERMLTQSRFGWILLATSGLSLVGNGIVSVIIPWLVLTRTGDVRQAGLVAAAAVIALMASSLLGGALIDRWGRRRMTAAADALSALSIASIAVLFDAVSLPVLMLLVALGAIFDGPGGAARAALQPATARRSGWGLDRLTARAEAVEALAAITGPAVAGLALLSLGPGVALWATAALLAGSAILSWRGLPPDALGPAQAGYWRETRRGLSLVVCDPALRTIAILGSVLILVLAPLEAVLLPAWFAAQGNPGGLTLVLLGFALGGIAGALGWPL
ncbi:MAG: MFS transporter, partial [Angustibacter sp.]